VEGHSRCRLIGATAAVAAAMAAAGSAASAGHVTQTGTFALLDGTPKIVSKLWTLPPAGADATIKVRQYELDGKPILDYEVDMQKLMHMVIVRDDFATFAHLHPAFDTTTGTFAQQFSKAPNHRYYVYADTTPRGVAQQVFRFTLGSDGPASTASFDTAASAPEVTAGPYAVSLSRTTLAADTPQRLDVTVRKNGKPAQDLGTYLGAAAHAVFINTSTLAYVHVHPRVLGAQSSMNDGMAMGMSGIAGPFMRMSLPPLPAASYKLWIQFRGANDVVYTAPFTLVAR